MVLSETPTAPVGVDDTPHHVRTVVVLISDNPPQDLPPRVVVLPWSGPPRSLLGFAAIILEVPRVLPAPAWIAQELRDLRRTQGRILWLLPPGSRVDLVREQLTIDVYPRRPPLPNTPNRVDSPSQGVLRRVFDSCSELHATLDGTDWTAESSVDGLPVAMSRTHTRGCWELCLVTSTTIDMLGIDLISRLSAIQSPYASAGTLRRLVFLCVVLAVGVTVDRYCQRRQNARLIESADTTTFVHKGQVPLQGMTPDESKALIAGDWSRTHFASAPGRQLELLHNVGLPAIEARAIARLRMAPPSDIDAVLARYASRCLLRTAFAAARSGRFEIARYNAQRALNILYDLPSSHQVYTNSAQAILGLINGSNFLYYDMSAMHRFVDHIDRFQLSEQSAGVDSGLSSPSLRDDVAYYNLAVGDHVTSREWDEFGTAFPHSSHLAEAAFNSIVADIQSFENEHAQSRASSKPIFGRIERFLTTHPRSYLADDAIFQALLFSLHDLSDVNVAAYWMKRMFSDPSYRSSDCAKRVTIDIRHALVGPMDVSVATPAEIDALVRQLSISPPASNFRSIESSVHTDDSTAHLYAIIFRMDKQRLDASTAGAILRRTLGRWKQTVDDQWTDTHSPQ
jgi:hypothetical protein